MKTMNNKRSTRSKTSVVSLMLYVASLLFTGNSYAVAGHEKDPHYTDAGFFDIHVCNWPNRPLFFMALFSTTHFDKIKKIEIRDNHNKVIGELPLNKFRVVMLEKPKREKRVFITQINLPKGSQNGWYSAKVTMKNKKVITAKDYVIIDKIDIASDRKPAKDAKLQDIPENLSWKAVPGAQYYQVFITDYWNDNKVYSSDLLTKPTFTPPKDLLQSGGTYCWRVHARDTNEHILLGDFNHGSLTQCTDFEIQ